MTTVARMLNSARARARKDRLPFRITEADIYIPKVCPALGIPLQVATGKGPQPGSPSLDKFDRARGYVPGNVYVISYRANAIKGTYTLEELRSGVEIARLYNPPDYMHEWERVLRWMEAVRDFL